MLFREWGHAALCVDRLCFNYGLTDFSRPVALTWEVLAGRARFWLGVSSYEQTFAQYASHGRSILRQDLFLEEEQREALLGRLGFDLRPGSSEYTYNHFTENCATRIRDYLNQATGGSLSRVADIPAIFEDSEGELTFRSQIRRGLASRPLLLWVSDVGVGSAVDQPIPPFQAMFVPGGLRHGIQRAFEAEPVRLREGRDGDRMGPDPGSAPYLPWLFGIALGIAAAVRLGEGRRLGRAARIASGVLLGGIGVAGATAVFVSPLPEFYTSALPLVLPPTDLLLASRFAPWYARLRLAFGGVAFLALLLGATTQPLLWTAVAALLPVGAIAFSGRRDPEA